MTNLIVDGNNILSRATFAAKAGRAQMSVDGVNTSALTIFISMLSKYVRTIQPTHMAVCWDNGHKYRDAIYPEYKANRNIRPDEPEEESTPFGQAKEFLTWAGIAHLARPGWEADDLIAVIAHQSRFSSDSTVIMSGDKDLLQLVDGTTTQIRPPDDIPWTTDRVADVLGVLPANIPLYMALTGDTGDNVPGVRGIGPKKAVALLEKVGWEWEPLLVELGEEKAAAAVMSRRLVDLRYPEFAAYGDDVYGMLTDISAPAFTPTAAGGMLWEPLVSFLKKWQMNSVLLRLNEGTLWYQGGLDAAATAETFADLDF